MSYAGYKSFQELFHSGLKINIGSSDNYRFPFGLYRNHTYKEVYENYPAYVKWILCQKNIKRDHPFMHSYFLNRMKEHDKD